MATETWSYKGYSAENDGKQYVRKVDYRVVTQDGDYKETSRGFVILARPSDSDMVDRETWATEENIINAIKANLGDAKLAEIRADHADRLEECKVPYTWHYNR